MTENQQARKKLQDELRKLFQFDVSDLDFGIYRILNRKKDQIEKFIEKDLLDAVEKGLEAYQAGDRKKFEEQLEKTKKKIPPQAFDEHGNIKEDFEGFEDVKKYQEAEEALKNLSVSEDTEKKIYNDLFTFFSRYYSEGDFVTKRRISTRDSKYAVPYNGEEVLLHWANKDQYYIKTGEHFTNYKFEVDGKSVWFKVAQAEQDRDNVKEEEKRSFVLRPDNPIEVNDDELTIWFEYRPLTDEEEDQWLKVYNSVEKPRKTIDRQALCIAYDEWIRSEVDGEWRKLLSVIPQNKDRAILYQKLNHYTGKNTTDYFIHKDLQSFLERELEYYLKNEVIRVDDFIEDQTEQAMDVALTRAKVVRSIGKKIIAFLSQIENFQKKLFEKRKFVVDTHYCFTLDRVPEKLYKTILHNEQQLKVWEELYAMEKWDGELNWDGNWTKVFLQDHPFLMVDTKWFGDEFKYELLASIDELEETLRGLLINGENFQGINLLAQKFDDKVHCIYIDPPYNAKSSEILYKNSFKHSSWLSFIENRVSLSKRVMNAEGSLIVAIDENERERLSGLLDQVFPTYDKTCVTVVHNPAGVQGNNFSYSHESAFFVFPSGGEYIGDTERDEPLVSAFRDWGGTSHRKLAKNCFYPILVEDDKIVGFGEVSDEDFHPESSNIKKDGITYIYPVDSKGVERKWVFSRNTVEKNQDQLFLKEQDDEIVVMRKKMFRKYRTVWHDKKYYANIYGSRLLSNYFGYLPFDFPKSVHTVEDSIKAILSVKKEGSFILDYFAGSGTTGHAVLNLNKEDKGDRNYLLIEMGQYFDTVLKPRIQKVVFSNKWKDGIPQDRNGQSHAFKYHFIESYEDALNNIDFKNPEDTQQAMEFEDYMLSYMLDFETQGVSASLLKDGAFETPFSYKLNIQRGHESPSEETVDLVETFHYLIGLWVQKLRRLEHQNRKYIISIGQIRDEDAVEDVCIIWRNTKDLDLDEEAGWVQKEIIKDQTFDRMYINGVSKVKDAEPIEITFREKMFEGVV
jgi:adenine-specific DNA-methyltransferase